MASSNTTFNRNVAEAVEKGLSDERKTLPGWLFYDERGDDLFQQIMRIPEYYPTRCEYDILEKYKEDLREHFENAGGHFSLIELGAGDGLKTEILLKHFLERGADFTYIPVDISANAVNKLSQRLQDRLPALRIEGRNNTYDEVLAGLRGNGERKVILFMGANIGNFRTPDAAAFLKKLARPLTKNDFLLIGFDLIKDPRVIREAYDDPKGITAAFNVNILTRLNRELGAQFRTDRFSHYPCYDPEAGANRSFLISMEDQHVYVEALGKSIHFNQWETIQTEISQKYSVAMINKLLALTSLELVEFFYDDDRYFTDVLVRGA